LLYNAQGHGGDVLGGEMDPAKVKLPPAKPGVYWVSASKVPITP